MAARLINKMRATRFIRKSKKDRQKQRQKEKEKEKQVKQ